MSEQPGPPELAPSVLRNRSVTSVCIRDTETPPKRQRSAAWWQSASMCVPLCSIIVMTPEELDREPSVSGR